MTNTFADNFEDLLHKLNHGSVHLMYEHGFKGAQMQQFVHQLSNSRTLKKLMLFSCGLEGQNGVELCHALRRNNVLTLLDLTTNDLSNDATYLLGEYIRENTSLTHLNLQRNKLTNDRLEPLCKAMKRNSTLTKLNLNFNRFTLEDTKMLSEMLALNVGLKTILLRMTIGELGYQGAFLIAEGLRQNHSLTDMSLAYNSIDSTGAEPIANALKENHSLTSLRLRVNDIGDNGVEALAGTLLTNRNLAIIDLDDNSVTDVGAKAICKSVRQNDIIRSFTMVHNKVSSKWKRRMESLLQKNREVHEKLFFGALGEGEKKGQWRRIKVMVVGEGGAGKTGTIRSLLGHTFNPKWVSTVGVDLSEAAITTGAKQWQVGSRGSHAVALANRIAWEKFDAGRQERRRMSSSRSSVTRDSARIDTESTQERAGDASDATETQLRSRSKQQERGGKGYERRGPRATVIEKKGFVEPRPQTAEEHRVFNPRLFIGSQAGETDVKVQIWDYGGQQVFYTMHHLFLTRHGVALVVCSLRDYATKPGTTMGYVEFWLQSIFLHAEEVPVVIVGTFADQVDADVLRRFGAELRHVDVAGEPLSAVENEDGELFFPIDNRSGNGLRQLRTGLDSVIRSRDCVRFDVSMKWMKYLDAMLHRDANWIGYSSIRSLLEASGESLSAIELDEMLSFFHELGMILHFTSSSKLKSIVTTRPQWLIDKISLVIRDKVRHGHGLDRHTLQVVGLDADAALLAQRGLASRDLLEFLWEKEQVEFFIELMRSLLLLSAYNFRNNDALYLIPSMAMVVHPRSYFGVLKQAIGKLISPASPRLTAVISFEFLQNGVFERLICLCTELSAMRNGTQEPRIGFESCRVWWDADATLDMLKVKEDNAVRLVVSRAEVAPNVLQVMNVMLRKIKSDVMGDAFRWTLKVMEDGQFVEIGQLQRPEESVWTVVGDRDSDRDGVEEPQLMLDEFFDSF